MFYKYYSCNVTQQHVGIIGSRVVRVYFFTSPVSAYEAICKTLSLDKSIVDFKRIK